MSLSTYPQKVKWVWYILRFHFVSYELKNIKMDKNVFFWLAFKSDFLLEVIIVDAVPLSRSVMTK